MFYQIYKLILRILINKIDCYYILIIKNYLTLLKAQKQGLQILTYGQQSNNKTLTAIHP